MSRLPLLQALQTQLETIKTTNGYTSNIGNAVTYWDSYEVDYNGPDAVTFRDVETQYQRVNQKYVNKLNVEIEAIAYTKQADKLTLSVGLLEDIKTAIAVKPWGQNIIAVRPMLDSKQIEGKGKQCISVVLTVEIEYRESSL